MYGWINLKYIFLSIWRLYCTFTKRYNKNNHKLKTASFPFRYEFCFFFVLKRKMLQGLCPRLKILPCKKSSSMLLKLAMLSIVEWKKKLFSSLKINEILVVTLFCESFESQNVWENILVFRYTILYVGSIQLCKLCDLYVWIVKEFKIYCRLLIFRKIYIINCSNLKSLKVN